MSASYVIGLDYGSDSMRALVVDVADGREVAEAVAAYPRWAKGLYCDPARQQFRQHPLDYLECLEQAVGEALAAAGRGVAANVVGIGVDTTGSTPVAVDKAGEALALKPAFADNPNAMFVLWKDHTAIAEAEEINALAHSGGTDFTRFSGGIYSSEWFFAKILHVLRADRAVAKAAFSWVEHCDWLPAVLCGMTDPLKLKRSRCAAGHKAMWHPSWKGLPAQSFLSALDPRLDGIRERLYRETSTADEIAGYLGEEWAGRLGLPVGIPVAVGAFDAHFGAVGAGAGPYVLAKVMGTSTCDMLTAPAGDIGRRCIPGICGQVDGSIVPGLMGLEAGQSSFGDVYAWYKRLLCWPTEVVLEAADGIGARSKAQVRKAVGGGLLPMLDQLAAALPIEADAPIALDWFNGRRTPDADQRVQAAIAGLHLGTDPVRVYRSLVEATALGAKAIVERFVDSGIPVKKILALGGIARKSPLVVQACADAMGRPISVVASDQCCALGAAIMGATAAGCYKTVGAAMKKMASPVEKTYRPSKQMTAFYQERFARYQALGAYAQGAC